MPQTRGQRGQNGDEDELPSRPPSPPRGTRSRGARASAARRGGAGSTVGRRSPSVGEPQDDIAAQHAELQRQVRVQRQQREIEAMQRELAGEDPGVDVEIEGVSLPVRKRRRNSSDVTESSERSFLRGLKMSETPSFHGKSQRELQTFNIGWKNIFRGRESASVSVWTDRINIVGQRLRGDAAVAWNRNKEVYTSWEQFINFLRTTLADSAVRMAEALQTLYSFQQGEKQKVQELLIEIERLEEDISEMSEEVRKAWILLLAIKPEIRTSVLSEHKEITSREQVLASAARHEQAQSLEAATKSKAPKHESNATRSALAPKTHERSSTTATQSGPRRVEEYTHTRVAERSTAPSLQQNSRGPQCYKCNGFGHMQGNCPNNRVTSNSHPASGANAIKPHDGPKK